MAKYRARTIAPGMYDKDIIHYSQGGNNRCIEIEDGYCIPNCVGYSWFRWRELLGKDPKLSRNNAESWWGYTQDGYKRGQTPKVGAVICWRKGVVGVESDGAGHVAIVEQVKANGDIVTSESVYGGARWRMCTYTKKSNYYLAPGYVFQGFIYIPMTFKLENKKYTTGTYRVTAPTLVVRSGAGTAYSKKKFSKLTANAQAQVKKFCGIAYDGYVKGMEFTVTKVKGRWGKTPSGWVSLDHCKKI